MQDQMKIIDGDGHVFEDNEAIGQSLRAGARGYLVKGAPQAEIVETIRGVYAGRAVIGAATAKQLANVFGSGSAADPFPDLLLHQQLHHS